jgi:hypothetical protein
MSWFGNLFGFEETIEDAVVYEELDEQFDIDDSRDAWEDDDEEGYAYDRTPPRVRVWWRL